MPRLGCRKLFELYKQGHELTKAQIKRVRHNLLARKATREQNPPPPRTRHVFTSRTVSAALLALVMLVGLTGCGNVTPAQQAYNDRVLFNTALDGINAGVALGYLPKSDVPKIKPYAAATAAALDAADTAVASGNATAFSVAIQAVDAGLKQLIAEAAVANTNKHNRPIAVVTAPAATQPVLPDKP